MWSGLRADLVLDIANDSSTFPPRSALETRLPTPDESFTTKVFTYVSRRGDFVVTESALTETYHTGWIPILRVV
jgi:hypothetical protein